MEHFWIGGRDVFRNTTDATGGRYNIYGLSAEINYIPCEILQT